MLNRLSVLLRSRLMTVVLSVLVIAASLSYGIKFELRARLDREVQAMAAVHKSLSLEQFNAPKVSPETNAAPLYMAAIELNSSSGVQSYPTMEETLDKDGDKVQRMLAARAPTWTLLDLAYQLPDCSYAFDMKQGYTMRCPNYLAVRAMAQLVSARALVDLRQGHPQEAVDVLTHFLCFSRRFHYGESLIQTMIRVAIDNIALEPMQKMIHDRVPADYSALVREIDLLATDMKGALDRNIDGERAMVYQLLSSQDSTLTEVNDSAHNDDWHDTFKRLAYQVAEPTLALADQAVVLETFRKYQDSLHDLDDPGFPPTQGYVGPDDGRRTEFDRQIKAFDQALADRHSALAAPPFERSLLLAFDLLPNMKRAAFQVRFLQANLATVRQQLAQLNSH